MTSSSARTPAPAAAPSPLVRAIRRAFGVLFALFQLVNPYLVLKNLYGAIRTLVAKVPLAWSLARRDLHSRHRAQFLGALWTLVHPLAQMLIFVFIFGVVFKARIQNSFEMPRDYTTYILSGLVPWIACVPAFTISAGTILNSAGLVKQFHFDTIVLPLRDVLTTGYFWAVGLAVVIVYLAFSSTGVPWTVALLPAVLLLTFFFLTGLGWLFAAVTTFFKDFKEIIIVLVSMLVYMLPIVYLPEWTPEAFRGAIHVNPLSYMIWVYQDVFYFGRIAHPVAWVVFTATSLFTLATGYRVFQRLKPYFGNVL